MNGPGDLSIEEYPWPDLEPGALLMKVEYCGICGTDKHAYRGELVHLKGTEAEFSTAFPLIPGHEMVGTVAEITPGAVTNIEYGGQALEVGDRIAVAPSVLCGHCYYCRHPNGYPYCVNQ